MVIRSGYDAEPDEVRPMFWLPNEILRFRAVTEYFAPPRKWAYRAKKKKSIFLNLNGP